MYPSASRQVAARHMLAETRALIARMSPAPDATRARLLNRFVRDLKNAGLWANANITALYVAGHNVQAGRLNLFAANSASPSGTTGPVYTNDRGDAGDGVDAILTCAVGAGAAGDHHAGIYLQSGSVGLSFGGSGVGSLFASSTSIETRSGSAFSHNKATTGLRHGVINRTNGTDFQHYRNGAALETVTDTATSYSSSAALLHTYTSSLGASVYTTGRAFAWHYGKALTAGQIADLYAILTTYGTAIGAV